MQYLLYFHPGEHHAAVAYMDRIRAAGDECQGRNGQYFTTQPICEVDWIKDEARNRGTVLFSKLCPDVGRVYANFLAAHQDLHAKIQEVSLELPQTPTEEVLASIPETIKVRPPDPPPLPDKPVDWDGMRFAQLQEETQRLTGQKPKSRKACMEALKEIGVQS